MMHWLQDFGPSLLFVAVSAIVGAVVWQVVDAIFDHFRGIKN